MTKVIQPTNKRTGYINVGITSYLYAQCELYARMAEQTVNEYVHVAIQKRNAAIEKDNRNALYIQACDRARENNRPTPLRYEFDQMMGWD
jgi:hypothetical protein